MPWSQLEWDSHSNYEGQSACNNNTNNNNTRDRCLNNISHNYNNNNNNNNINSSCSSIRGGNSWQGGGSLDNKTHTPPYTNKPLACRLNSCNQ